MIHVNARLFRAASLFTGTDVSRYYIHGVCIEPHADGALLVATDGHRLIAVLDRQGSAERKAIIRLPHHMLAACVEDVEVDDVENETVFHERCEDRTLHVFADGTVELDGLRTVKSCEIDGKFPEWRKVFPSGPINPRAMPSFNAELLGDFAEVADLLGDRNNKQVHIAPSDEAGPALIFFPVCRDALGVIMPTRSALAQKDIAVPAWIGVSQNG